MKTPLNLSFKCCFVVATGLFIAVYQKEQPTANTVDGLYGVYTLVSIDGKPVPTSVSEQSRTLEVRSGPFTINANGTCSNPIIFIPLGETEVTHEASATYTMHGSTLTLH